MRSLVVEFVLPLVAVFGKLVATEDVCDLACEHGTCEILPVEHENSFENEVAKPKCVCDEGFSGRKCQHENTVCPDGLLVCMNGSNCRPHPGKNGLTKEERRHFGDDLPEYLCDCSVIDDINPYAGVQCEHYSSRNCAILAGRKHSFCVNGGKCKDTTTNAGVHHGCHCPTHYEGDHCEFKKIIDTENTRKEKNNNETTSSENTTLSTPLAPPKKSVKEETNNDQEGKHFSRLAKIAITFGSATLVAIVILIYYQHRQRFLSEATTSTIEDNGIKTTAKEII